MAGSGFGPVATATTAISGRRVANLSKDGISSRQGMHHVAHRFNTSHLPFVPSKPVTSSANPTKATCGRGLGASSVSLAMAPFNKAGSTDPAAATFAQAKKAV